LAIPARQAAPLTATVELVRARPEDRIYVAGIGVWINRRWALKKNKKKQEKQL